MSGISKLSLVLVIAVVAVGVWFIFSRPASDATPAPAETSNTVSSISADSSLDADLSAIDMQLQVVSDDSAAVGQGFNDTPVEQVQ